MLRRSSARRFPDGVRAARAGTTIEQAQQELGTMARRFAENSDSNANRGFGVMSIHDLFYGGAKEPLLILQGAVLFVLLIACPTSRACCWLGRRRARRKSRSAAPWARPAAV
jgi:hypothetical protein